MKNMCIWREEMGRESKCDIKGESWRISKKGSIK